MPTFGENSKKVTVACPVRTDTPLGGEVGWSLPKGIKGAGIAMTPTIITIVRENEMDMERYLRRASGSRVRQLIASLWSRSMGGERIGNPRRSIDREQQEYTPYYE